MLRHRHIRVTWALVCAASLCTAAQGLDESWWNEDWTCRKTVQVEPVGLLKQDLAAAVAFTTGGRLQDDAADLRIIDEHGAETPYHIIAAGFDAWCVVAFPVQYAQQVFQFYYGNAKARRPRYDWQPKRGLVLEVRTLGKGGIDNWEQMRALIENSPAVQGRALHNCVFDGHNRFGPSDRYISIYRGYLHCPVSGEYRFATTSDDASFLFLDSKLIVQWPGKHDAVPDARHQASVQVDSGVRFFEYYHVDVGGAQVAEAAWRPPGQEDFVVIPPEAFVPFWWGYVTAYEQRDDPEPIDFSFGQGSSLPSGNSVVSAVQFRIDFPARTDRDIREWDFGDGITSKDRSPVHVYVQPGTYRVRLSLGDKQVTQAVGVRNDERIGDAPSEEVAAEYLRILRTYDLSLMPVGHLLAIRQFAQEYEALDLEYNTLIALERMRESYRDKAAGHALLDHAENLWRVGHYDAAVDVLGKLGTRHSEEEVALTALHRKGQCLLALDKTAEARAAFEALDDQSFGSDTFRALARMDAGDCYRHRGDGRSAREAYAEAQEISEKPAGGAPLAQGAYAQAAVEYLRADKIDAAVAQIEKWEAALPLDKLDGYFSLLKTVALVKTGDIVRANAEARDQYRVNPEGNYAPHMLLLQGDCLALWQQTEKAQEKYLKLVEDYPESPLRPIAEYRAETLPKAIEELEFPVVDF